MAVTVSLYNHTAAKFAEGSFKEGDTYKLMLLDASGTFTGANTVVGDVSANEVSGNGWTGRMMPVSGNSQAGSAKPGEIMSQPYQGTTNCQTIPFPEENVACPEPAA